MTGASDLTSRIPLGRSGKAVSRLGIGASYGVSKKACLEAYDAGVNFFFWGSSRTPGMALALRDLGAARRDDLCIVLQCYARSPSLVSRSVRKGLEALKTDYADVLLLGWHERPPGRRTLEAVEEERSRGTFRYLGISSHQRPLFRDFLGAGHFDVFHLRYNAAHTGAESDVFPFLPDEGGPGIVAFTCTRWGDLMNPNKMPPGEAPLSAGECYRFAVSNPFVHVAITGPKSDAEMRQALEAMRQGPLDPEESARIRAIGDYVHSQKSVADWFR